MPSLLVRHRTALAVAAAVVLGLLALSWPAYMTGKAVSERHIARWGRRLVDLERRGLLSTEFGAAWQEILAGQSMQARAAAITADTAVRRDSIVMVDGVLLRDYPSLSLVARLNEVNAYANTIEITDRKGLRIALMRTDHTRGRLDEFPQTLVKALVAAEDERFWDNNLGFEYRSYVRAALRAAWRSLISFRPRSPQGTSTITQQVAKLFISHLDPEGRRLVSRSMDRKLREMRIAAALRIMYRPEEILEVYLNHCVTSDYGLVGCKDIALGLFGRKPSELSDAQCVYLARMVKWGRNLRDRITRQCRIDMPRMAEACGWDKARQDSILRQIDSLTFIQPRRVLTDHGQLVDCANEYWLRVLARAGASPGECDAMDILNPNSLVRKKGNLVLQITIDLPLQRALERLVNARGYGPDTTVVTEARIGSTGELVRAAAPRDTLRRVEVLAQARTFSEPGAEYTVSLSTGDTLISNIRYTSLGKGSYRRSVFYYARRPVTVGGQYYAYAIMDSRTGRLLAYYSRDRIGSRLAGLTRYRTPNGSSTAKPILNALCFDLGVFKPYEMWNDSLPVPAPAAWRRTLVYERGKPVGVLFEKSAVRGRGYEVHNHENVFEGCRHIFEQLAASNNILGVETCYRLDQQLLDRQGSVLPSALALGQYFYRIGALPRIRDQLRLSSVTGVRVYKELVRVAGAPADSLSAGDRRTYVSDSLYSVALGTLELSLLEQMHLYNVLYNNDLIERPAEHPSLFLQSITLNNRPVPVPDTLKRCHPFADINNLRPTYLGMHLRLVSNRWERLEPYDIGWPHDSAAAADSAFDPNDLAIDEPLANFAKSGTTDDVIRPFYASGTSAERTNFGVWNAVLRVDLGRLAGDSTSEVRDITLACIGECVTRYTGPRDGKTLHGFLTRELLKEAGVKAQGGFFRQYEDYLRRTTPPEARNCGRPVGTSAAAVDSLTAKSVAE